MLALVFVSKWSEAALSPMSIVPMARPGLLFAVSWTLLLSPRIGMFNVWIRDLLGLFGVEMSEGPFDIYSGMPAMIFLEGLRGVTTTFLIVVGGFRAMDPALEEAHLHLRQIRRFFGHHQTSEGNTNQ